MKFKRCLCLALLISMPVLADNNLIELEEILLTELESTSELKSSFISEHDGTTNTNKVNSIQEMLSSLGSCKEEDEIVSDKQSTDEITIIAFACRRGESEIISAEVLIREENGISKILSYQEMIMEERTMSPDQLTNLAFNYDLARVNSFAPVSPGVRTLFTLAKVGVPVFLSFKFAKLIAPSRTDWQKHFIAGAIISGVTVLTAEGLIRTIARRNGYNFSNLQMNLMTSFAGLIGSMAAGISKELYDKYSGKGTPEISDAVYSAAGGAFVGLTITIPIESIFRIRRRRPRP